MPEAKKIHIFTFLSFFSTILSAQPFTPQGIGRTDDDGDWFNENPCDEKVRVADERPETSCNFFNGVNNFYPVFIEEFDYKSELPNNWTFNLVYTKDDNAEASTNGKTWMGDPYANNNIYTLGGYGYLEWRKEFTSMVQANNNVPPKNYDYTGGMLNSLFFSRQGIYEARIKLPNNPNFWPAFWISNNQEIDIFEFFDANLSDENTCDTYHMMKVNMHGYIDNGNINISRGGIHCNRNRKFPVNNDFFNNFHTYKCLWTDYRIEIWVDNYLVVGATRYYDAPFNLSDGCANNADGGVPQWARSCEYMRDAVACNSTVFGGCVDWNQVYKDLTFPKTSISMKLLITNAIHPNNFSSLTSGWNNFSSTDKQIIVDYIKVYQPFENLSSRQINTIADYKNFNGNTSFLTASDIQVGSSGSSTFQINSVPWVSTDPPVHLLATEHISFLNDVVVQEGAYLRAEIVDGNGLILSERNTSVTLKDSATIDITPLKENVSNSKFTLSSNDNGAISIYPNPTSESLFVDMDEEDYNDLMRIEITNSLGQKMPTSRSRRISVETIPAGMYFIKFVFTSGYVVDKIFVKN